MWSVVFCFCVRGVCLSAIISLFSHCVFRSLLPWRIKENSETRDSHHYYICCSNARFYTSFLRLTTNVAHEWGLVRGVLMCPVWVSNLFTSQFRRVRMSLSEFRPKPLIGKTFVYKHCFCCCVFHQTPCYPHPVFSTPSVFHTLRFPHPAFTTPRVFHTPRFPLPAFPTTRVFHTTRFSYPGTAYPVPRVPDSAFST